MTSATGVLNLRRCLWTRRKRFLRLFNADDSYYSVIVSGSGTSANETVLSSIFQPGEEVLLIRNGLFGERLLEIIRGRMAL